MNRQASGARGLFQAKCRQAGLKITPQRLIIYESLASDKSHPCAEEVFRKAKEKFPNISFDTVNRTLLSFAGIGMLKVVEGHGRPKRFDPDMKSHHHFQCIKCARIIDFHNPYYDALDVPGSIKGVSAVTGKKVVLEGLCSNCKR